MRYVLPEKIFPFTTGMEMPKMKDWKMPGECIWEIVWYFLIIIKLTQSFNASSNRTASSEKLLSLSKNPLKFGDEIFLNGILPKNWTPTATPSLNNGQPPVTTDIPTNGSKTKFEGVSSRVACGVITKTVGSSTNEIVLHERGEQTFNILLITNVDDVLT